MRRTLLAVGFAVLMSMLLAPHGGKYGVEGWGPFFSPQGFQVTSRGIWYGGAGRVMIDMLALFAIAVNIRWRRKKAGAIFTHQVEQDTFTANGQTLVGDPFTAEFQLLFDSGGSVIHAYATGLFETIHLPDGSLFVSAGRADFTQHPGVGFLLSPDMGNPGNLAGFCAALSP